MGDDTLRAHYREGTDLKRLQQIGPNQMRVFTSLTKPAVAGDPIDLVLRLGLMNLEAYLADEAAIRDMVTDRGFGSLLSAKVARFTSGQVAKDAFSTLATLEGLPDFPSLATAGSLDLAEAWKFRNSHSARQFRSWFSSHKAVGSQEMAQEYTRRLKDEGPWKAGPVKALRFIAVQAGSIALSAGTGSNPVAGAIAGTGLGLADSYLLERIRLGFNPRYFLDDMRHRLFAKYPAF